MNLRARRTLEFVLDNLVWFMLLFVLAVFSLFIPNYFQLGIFANIVEASSVLGVMSIGLALVVISGHMDLSVESVAALGAMAVGILFCSAGIGMARWKKTGRGREVWDRAMLRIPFKIGDVVQKVAIARWSRIFAGTISAGVPILQAVRISGETSGNAVVAEAMEEVYNSVRSGGTIAKPLSENPIFPSMVTHMVSVGEDTGQLETMFGKIADFYEAEVDAKIRALTSLIEPVMIMFVGGVVGFIVISMYLPIFALYDNIR